MPKVDKNSRKDELKDLRPQLSQESQESRLTSLAIELAERQLREGTASSQVITQCLKLGSRRERMELEKLKIETEFYQAKANAYKAMQKQEELYSKVIEALKEYGGYGDSDEEDVL